MIHALMCAYIPRLQHAGTCKSFMASRRATVLFTPCFAANERSRTS